MPRISENQGQLRQPAASIPNTRSVGQETATLATSATVHTELIVRDTRQLHAGELDEAMTSSQESEELAGTAARTLETLQQADRAHAEGQLKLANGLYLWVLARNPCLVEAYLGLARIAFATGQLDLARVYAAAATRLGPRLGLGWTLLAAAKEAQGDAAGALPLFAKGASLSPDVFLCQLNLGRALLSLDRPKEAVDPLAAATALEPESADAFGFLGRAQLQADRPLPALRALERAQQLDQRNISRWVDPAEALSWGGGLPAMAGLTDDRLTRMGERAVLLEKAAAAALPPRDAPLAIDHVKRELAVAPNLARLNLTTRDFDLAEQAAQALLDKRAKHGEALLLLRNLYEAVGLKNKAVDASDRAIVADEQDAELLDSEVRQRPPALQGT